MQSMITVPSAGDVLGFKDAARGSVEVRGLAWGGGGEGVNRVDVSLDGGKTFTRAELEAQPIPAQRRKAQWAWQFFRKEVPLPAEARKRLARGEPVKLELTSKALNTSWNVQPESPDAQWNAHGCCVNHWYKVPVSLDPTKAGDERGAASDFANKPSGGEFRRPFTNMLPPR